MLGRNLRKAPWQLLSGLDEPRSGFHRPLFLFQIKYWLTGHEDMKEAFARATTYFVLYAFQDGLKQYGNSKPAWKMKDLLRNPSYRDLYNFAYARNDPTGVLGLPIFEEEVEWRDRYRVYMKAESHFTLCRLAFVIEKEDSRLEWAERYHERYRPRDIVGLSKKDKYRGYADRAAYLAAASLALPQLLDFDVDSVRVRDEKVPRPQDFRLFCSYVRAIAKALDCPGNAEIELWTGQEPIMPELSPIPSELLAEWSAQSRRSAETTALGDKGRRMAQPKTSRA